MRGCVRRALGTISKPVTREDAWSQMGLTPMSAKACARSSPPVRMVALAQRSMTIRFGHSPWSWTCRFRTSSAARWPISRSGAHRHSTRINAIEIASRGEHIDASARWSAAWSGLDKAAIERGEERRFFRFPAVIDKSAHPLGQQQAAIFLRRERILERLRKCFHGCITQGGLRRVPEDM